MAATARIALLLALMALAAQGCGFHLRTWDLGASVESVFVEANPRNPMTAPLERGLRQAGVTLAGSSQEADLVVTLLDSRRLRRSISVSQARAAEYEMILGVRYQVSDGAGNVLTPAQWLERERVFRVDRDNIVGSSEEQALLEREMESDLVGQIIRALNAVVTEPDGAA